MRPDSGGDNAADKPLTLSASVGRLRVEGLLGRGGVGCVYRAFDSARGKAVALKRLELGDELAENTTSVSSASASAHTTNEDTRRLARRRTMLTSFFQREFHTLAQLAHPRIIEVYDYGIDEQGPYYTMELLAGSDLSHLAPMPWRRTCEVLRDVASALTLLHSRRLLHRDISPRNVHCAAAGAAKLIDFGAMSPMGPCDVVVGTPAFVAPEVVQNQMLDARTDLYSLGSLGYFLLTGRVAYPARSFSDLRDAYRSFPPAPSFLVADIPRAVDALIMRLISLDRGARPSSAVELVERFTALAGLEPDPRLAVASAYLSTPSLVGRHKELLSVRRRTLRSQRGRGASLLVTGPSGVGRSRFLDACALEGKLAGAYVLRGAPGASGGVEHGVVRSLLVQLHGLLTDAERRTYELSRSLSEQLAPGLIWARANSRPTSMRPSPTALDPTELPRSVQTYFERLVSQRAIMILIDDFQAIDEPSAAVFAGLAPLAARGRLVIIAACTTDAPVAAKGALSLFKSYSRALPLEPFTAGETESLLTSVFGAVPNLQQLAHRLHALSGGMPRVCMELAQHLLDTQVIRYETGGFVLPEELAADDVPASLEEALRVRFSHLSAAAQSMGCVVAMCAGTPLSVEQCSPLAGIEDVVEGERALNELVASQLIRIEDGHVSLGQGTVAAALLSGHDEALLRALQRRVAESFAQVAELRVRGAELYFMAGEQALGLDTLLAAVKTGRLTWETMANLHVVIAHGLRACDALNRPRLESFLLRRSQIHHRVHFCEPCDTQELLAFADELALMSGLTQWHALGHQQPALERDARLTEALKLAASAYESASPEDRIYSPQKAIPELARYLGALAGHGTATFDLDLLERIPPLGDFVLLAPGIQVSEWLVQSMRDLRASRHSASIAAMQRVLDRLVEPDHAGMPPHVHLATRLGVLYSVALTSAALGYPHALEQAEQLDELPSMRISAWRVRQIAHLYRGDLEQAEECRRQLELLLIQHGSAQANQGATLETELICYAVTDDLLNLRRVLPDAESLGLKHAGWRPLHALGCAELERIRGRLPQARVLYERALSMLEPGRHMMWPPAIGFYVRVLADLGEPEKAKELGLEALAHIEQIEMGALSNLVVAGLAYAEGKLGQVALATERVDAMLERVERDKLSGLSAALRYELRAELAVLANDAEAFAQSIQRCREHYRMNTDSPFAARVSRLVDAARASGLVHESGSLGERTMTGGSIARLRRELAQCPDVQARAERAIALLVEMTGALHGHLYGSQGGRLAHLASSHEGPPAKLRIEMEGFLERFAEGGSDVTEVVDSNAFAPCHTTIANEGVDYSPFAIHAEDESELIVAAVALAFGPEARRPPAQQLLSAIGEELTARGDVTLFSQMR